MNPPFEISANDYTEYFPNYNLESQSELNAYFKSASFTIWSYINDNSSINWNREVLSSEQLDFLKRAAMEQAAYLINNGGDISRFSGVSIDGSVAPVDFTKFEIAPKAKKILSRYGFLYRGLY